MELDTLSMHGKALDRSAAVAWQQNIIVLELELFPATQWRERETMEIGPSTDLHLVPELYWRGQ